MNAMEDSKTGLVGMKDLFNMSKEIRPRLVEGLLHSVGLSSWNAKAKTCKSTVLRQLAVSVAKGTPFLGRKVEQGRVIYYVMDDNRTNFAKAIVGLGGTLDDPIECRFGAVGM